MVHGSFGKAQASIRMFHTLADCLEITNWSAWMWSWSVDISGFNCGLWMWMFMVYSHLEWWSPINLHLSSYIVNYTCVIIFHPELVSRFDAPKCGLVPTMGQNHGLTLGWRSRPRSIAHQDGVPAALMTETVKNCDGDAPGNTVAKAIVWC